MSDYFHFSFSFFLPFLVLFRSCYRSSMFRNTFINRLQCSMDGDIMEEEEGGGLSATRVFFFFYCAVKIMKVILRCGFQICSGERRKFEGGPEMFSKLL